MLLIGVGLALAGCVSMNNPPLFFAQTQTFGARLHGSATEQTASLVVGYKGSDAAIVPVTATQNGEVVAICSLWGAKRDSLSVFGTFRGDANVSTTAGVGLKNFFATGIAADNLAEGYNPTQEGQRLANKLKNQARSLRVAAMAQNNAIARDAAIEGLLPPAESHCTPESSRQFAPPLG